MPKRIPHTDSEIIVGTKTAQDYLQMQKKLGRFYLKDFVNRLVKLNKKGDFLEIGSGPGYQTTIVAKQIPDTKIKALEPSPDMISIATEYSKAQDLDNKIQFIHGAVEDESLINSLGEFDLIYSSFSLHHWPDPKKAILNLYKALKDDGIIFIYDFKRSGLFYYIPLLRKGIWESIRASYTPIEIEKMLSELSINKYKIDSKYPYMAIIIRKQ
jgi:ubiquinone/menaquinone biosynthesis C-methylase UbiE